MLVPRSKHRIYATALAVGLLAGSSSAEPTPEQKSLARSLFDAGRESLLAGRYAESCAQFAESQRLDPQAGTQLNLAICRAREGKTATAWIELREAKNVATKSARADRVTIADEELKLLEPRLQRLVIEVPPASDLPDLQVSVDGTEWRRAAWGIATVLDPGKHAVRATAAGRAPFEGSVSLTEDGKTQRFAIPPLAPAAESPGPGVAGGVASPVPPAFGGPVRIPMPYFEPRPPNPWYTAGTWSMVVGGLAVVGAGTVSVVYLAKGWCYTRDRGRCPEDKRDDLGTARTLGWATLAGASVFTAGIFMTALAPYPKDQRAPVHVRVNLGPTGAALTGAF